ncbi:MAG: hypothetical protein FJX75_08275 [Armatimonadetes bacterium]|nr:hypothetical protein [Armatimonadota bacterium]
MKLWSGLKKAKDVTMKAVAAGTERAKEMIDEAALQRQLNEACLELGQKTFELMAAEKLDSAELTEAFVKVRELNEKLEAARAGAEAGKTRECAACKAPLDADAAFCTECGAEVAKAAAAS